MKPQECQEQQEFQTIMDQLTLEEKAILLTGAASMETAQIDRLGIPSKIFSDGPHGLRLDGTDDCVMFPSLSTAASTWDKKLIHKMGEAIAEDCIAHRVDTILGPGVNIKRTPVCGRNFEYFSEDPVLSGEMAAAYVNGLQSKGVGACVKHFALNNQEKYRMDISAEVDIRVMHELYLRAFEIAVKKSNPYSMMCAYNKVHSIWCSENKYLLTDVLRTDWGYEGLMVSDWHATRVPARAFAAGLDLQMPGNPHILRDIREGLEKGYVTEEEIDAAVRRVLRFLFRPVPVSDAPMSREEKHAIARAVATDGIVLLKNDKNVLPLTKERCKKIGVMGEYAVRPLRSGQGSAEVFTAETYMETPLDELQKVLGDDVEIQYLKTYSMHALPEEMIWPRRKKWENFVADCDAVIIFAGSMESEDTEQFDRCTIEINPNMEFVIDCVAQVHKNVIVVLQSGSALALGAWRKKVNGIVQTFLGGEGAGGALADVLTGKVNPSGKLAETFPTAQRKDMEYPGDGLKVVYREGFDVGYRYYDHHPEEIVYPFGYGLSYTRFAYKDVSISLTGETIHITLHIENTGDRDGAEVIQFYVAKDESCVTRSPKELKAFEKVFVPAGRQVDVAMDVPVSDLAYYHPLIHKWVIEPGSYRMMLAKSSRDIFFEKEIFIEGDAPYTVHHVACAVVG